MEIDDQESPRKKKQDEPHYEVLEEEPKPDKRQKTPDSHLNNDVELQGKENWRILENKNP